MAKSDASLPVGTPARKRMPPNGPRNLADGEEEDDTLDLTPGGDEPAETVAATDEEPAETKSTPATPLSSNAEQQKVNVMTFLEQGPPKPS